MLLLNLLIKPFWIFGIEVGVQNAVGPEEYGFYFSLFSLAYIFNILLDIGITNYNTRNIARHPHLIDQHLSGMLCLKMLLLVLYVVVTFTVGMLKGYGSRQFSLLAFLCLNQFLNSLILYLRSNFEGLLLFKWDSVISILDRVVMIIICGCMLWLPSHPDIRIEYFVYAQTAAYLFTALVAFVVLVTKIRRSHNPHFSLLPIRHSRSFAVDILKQSAPFALLVLLMASYNRIDPVLLEDLAQNGIFQSGIYAGAFRLLDALTMIAYLVSVPLLPIFSRLTREPSPNPQLASTTRLVFSLMAVFSIASAVTFSAMSDRLMPLLYRHDIDAFASVFTILVFDIIPISLTYIFGTLLTAAGRLRQLNLLAASTLAINVAADLVLIPRYGAVGSAWASLTAQSFMALAQTFIAFKTFKFHLSIGYTIKVTAFTLFIVAVNLILAACGDTLSWWLWLIAASLLTLAAAFTLRLIDIKELIIIIKQK